MIEKARPSDCTPPRARSSASSSILGSLVCTSFAIETLRGGACLSLVFNLVRDFTVSALQMVEANSIRPSSPGNCATHRARRNWDHTTIAIDVQYYEK